MANINDLIDSFDGEELDQTSTEFEGFALPPEGTAFLRLVEYVELGTHRTKKRGQGGADLGFEDAPQARITFELSGKKYPPRDTPNGPVPMTITQKMVKISRSDRSNFQKMFERIRGSAKHMIGLMGNRAAFMGTIKHNGKYANILMDTIEPAVNRIVQDGEVVLSPIQVAPHMTPLRAFIFNKEDTERERALWDALFIDGEYPERKDKEGNVTRPAASKNIIQETIRSALDFEQLGIYAYAKASNSAEAVKEEEELDDELAAALDTNKAPPAKAPPAKVVQATERVVFDDDIPF